MRIVGFVSILQQQVNDFLSECLPESGRTYDKEGRHSALTDIAANYKYFWVMLDDDQKVIGTVAVAALPFDPRYASVLHRNSAELKCLYLYKRYHGHGYGRRLIEFAIDQARAHGYSWLYLDTIRSSSQSALALYHEFNFTETDRYNDNPNADVFMRLKLQ